MTITSRLLSCGLITSHHYHVEKCDGSTSSDQPGLTEESSQHFLDTASHTSKGRFHGNLRKVTSSSILCSKALFSMDG